jgi:hypothetical protein
MLSHLYNLASRTDQENSLASETNKQLEFRALLLHYTDPHINTELLRYTDVCLGFR